MSFEDDEIKQERMNMFKGLFPLMRSWYVSNDVAHLREKYGPFPLFWQDLDSWAHTKILKKIYLTVTERKEAGLPKLDLLEVEKSFSASAATAESAPDGGIIEDKKVSAECEAGTDSRASRRKKSRWDTSVTNSNEDNILNHGASNSGDGNHANGSTSASSNESKSDGPAEESADTSKRMRRSRWSSDTVDASSVAAAPPAIPAATLPPAALANPLFQQQYAATLAAAQQQAPPTQEQVQQMLVLKMQLQQVNEQLMTVATDAARIELDPNRSPSPPPRYDAQGRRTNTRVIRMRERLMQERGELVSQLMKVHPQLAGPLDLLRTKPVRKLPIPVNMFPNQSFIGLIIGPRGNTQKRMEQETGCKISIKGKGMRGSANLPGEEDEELHVHITGDDEARVEQAAAMVLTLLRPQSEEVLNAHKEKQLRELALINGTLREDEYCPVCGEKGHKQYECPARIKSFKAAGVKCSLCGDGSHPTRDCPLKQHSAVGEGVLDSEYDSLMAELGGDAGSSRAPGDASESTYTSGNVHSSVTSTVDASGTRKQTVVVSQLMTDAEASPFEMPGVTSVTLVAPNMYGYYPTAVPGYGIPQPGYGYQPMFDPTTGAYYYYPMPGTAMPVPQPYNPATMQPYTTPMPAAPVPIQPPLPSSW